MAWISTTFIDTPSAHHGTRSPNERRYSKALLVTTLLLSALGLTRSAYAGGHTDQSLEFRHTKAEPPPPAPTSQATPVTPAAAPLSPAAGEQSQEQKDCLARFEADRKEAIAGCEDAFGLCSRNDGCPGCKLGVMLSFETRRASACPRR